MKITFFLEGAMPSLQVRELPVNIYQRLRKTAKAEHRSLAQEAVVTLARGLKTSASNKDRRKKLLKVIAEQPCCSNEQAAADPVLLVREDRKR